MIPALLEAIRAIYQQYAPDVLTQRFPPATDSDLAHFETILDAPLPADYRSFLQCNDLPYSFQDNFVCLDIQGMVRSWTLMTGLLERGVFADGRIPYHQAQGFGNWDGGYLQVCWWNRQWIPFAEDSCGNLHCLDGDPGLQGRLYQVLAMEIQDGQGPFVTEMASFTAYLHRHLRSLQGGHFVVESHGLEIIS